MASVRQLASRAGRAGTFPLRRPDWPNQLPRPRPSRHVGVDYNTNWARTRGVRAVRALLLDTVTKPIMRSIASPTIRGAEALQDLESPVIFASNHASHLDTPLLLTSLPAKFRHKAVVGAAADHFFDKTWKAAMWSFAASAIPIERHRVDRRSAQLAIDLIEDGWNLIIFPEGGRSPDGWAQPFRGGAAYVAKKTGVPVVPAHLGGTRHIWAKGGRFRPASTTVQFGSPLRCEDHEDTRHFATRIEQAVALLSDESATDWWTARKKAAAGSTPPLTGPTGSQWRRAWALGPPRRQEARSWPKP